MSDERAERIADFIGPLRVKPGSKVRLERDFDPRYKAGLKKREGTELLRTGVSLLAEYQERLAAQDTYGVLLCLQALDAGGKDGTIRHVMSGVNPQGVRVSSFKVPSAEELDHDYLWRYAQRLPRRGEIAIFNRSHYEEVLVVRVHPEILLRQKLPENACGRDLWDRRYREINHCRRLRAAGCPMLRQGRGPGGGGAGRHRARGGRDHPVGRRTGRACRGADRADGRRGAPGDGRGHP
jgi:polyphosphate kinase 2 (PPK2 family)